MLPIGQLLWEEGADVVQDLPAACKRRETYNLDGILRQIQSQRSKSEWRRRVEDGVTRRRLARVARLFNPRLYDEAKKKTGP